MWTFGGTIRFAFTHWNGLMESAWLFWIYSFGCVAFFLCLSDSLNWLADSFLVYFHDFKVKKYEIYKRRFLIQEPEHPLWTARHNVDRRNELIDRLNDVEEIDVNVSEKTTQEGLIQNTKYRPVRNQNAEGGIFLPGVDGIRAVVAEHSRVNKADSVIRETKRTYNTNYFARIVDTDNGIHENATFEYIGDVNMIDAALRFRDVLVIPDSEFKNNPDLILNDSFYCPYFSYIINYFKNKKDSNSLISSANHPVVEGMSNVDSSVFKSQERRLTNYAIVYVEKDIVGLLDPLVNIGHLFSWVHLGGGLDGRSFDSGTFTLTSNKNSKNVEILTLSEYVNFYKLDYISLWDKVNRKEVYMCSTDSGKIFLNDDENKLAKFYATGDFFPLTAEILKNNMKIRPAIINQMTTFGLMCSEADWHVKLSSGEKVFLNGKRQFYGYETRDVKFAGANYREFITENNNIKKTIMLGNGLIFVNNSTKHHGSGNLIDLNGKIYVLTNEHVVRSGEGRLNRIEKDGICIKQMTSHTRMIFRTSIKDTVLDLDISNVLLFGDDFAVCEINKKDMVDLNKVIKDFDIKLPQIAKIPENPCVYFNPVRQNERMHKKHNQVHLHDHLIRKNGEFWDVNIS